MIEVTPGEFKEFGKLVSDETDDFLNGFINSAIATINRLVGKAPDNIENTDSMKLATKILALHFYNMRDFPSPQMTEAIKQQVLTLIQDQIDLSAQTILTEPETTEASQ